MVGHQASLEVLEENINHLDLKEEVDELTYEVALEREEKIKEFWRIAKIQESILCQRSRFKWIKEGDVNTKLFHGIVNWRKRSNNIRGSKVDGESCEEPKKKLNN